VHLEVLPLAKYDPDEVEEVELNHATPNYALVRFPTGREATVSLRAIARSSGIQNENVSLNNLQQATVKYQKLLLVTMVFLAMSYRIMLLITLLTMKLFFPAIFLAMLMTP